MALHKRKGRLILWVFIFLLSFSYAVADGDTLPVRFHEQERWNWCGVAVIQSILEYYGVLESQREIAGELGYSSNPDRPALAISRMMDYFSYRGYDVSIYRAENGRGGMELLRSYVVQGVPVIVLQQRYIGSSEGHYRIVVGFREDRVVVIDPLSGLLFIPEEDFLSLWRANQATKYSNQMLVVKGET